MTPVEQIKALRQKVQKLKALRITEAQKYCADLVGVTLSGWQRWEQHERGLKSGRKIPQAALALATIKIKTIQSTIKI